jgi:hypothetical protein
MYIWLKIKGLNDTCMCWFINSTIIVYLIGYTQSSCITLVKMANGVIQIEQLIKIAKDF